MSNTARLLFSGPLNGTSCEMTCTERWRGSFVHENQDRFFDFVDTTFFFGKQTPVYSELLRVSACISKPPSDYTGMKVYLKLSTPRISL